MSSSNQHSILEKSVSSSKKDTDVADQEDDYDAYSDDFEEVRLYP